MCCKQLYLPTSGAIRALIDGKGEAVTHVGTTRPLYILYAVEPQTPSLMRLRIYVVYIRGCDTYVIALPFLYLGRIEGGSSNITVRHVGDVTVADPF